MNRIILRSTAVLLITAILLITPTMALADGGGDGYVATANGYQVELVFKEPAMTGENEFHIQIVDSMGMPIPNAEVEISCQPAEESSTHEESGNAETHGTDSMSGMEMATEAPATGVMRPNNESEPNAHDEEALTVMLEPAHESGEYSGKINIDKSGEWVFNVHFTINDEMMAVEIPVEVARAGTNLGILAGFLGFNVIVVTAAAIMKRKPILK